MFRRSVIFHIACRALIPNARTHVQYAPRLSGTALRYCSSQTSKSADADFAQPVGKVGRYIFSKYFRFILRYINTLEARFPFAVRVYSVFSVGIKEFYRDMKDYISAAIKARTYGYSSMKHSELEVYYRMPAEMTRVAPVLLVTALPAGQFLSFPIALMFPRLLLSSQFWSLQQRAQFAVQDLQKRLKNNRPVFRQLQAGIHTIEDEVLEDLSRTVFAKLGSGVHPTVKEVIALKPLFQSKPYHLNNIYGKHVRALYRMHGLNRFSWGRRMKLREHAEKIHLMDQAISRDGFTKMSATEIRKALFLRGLNPTKLDQGSMFRYLEHWLTVSAQVDASCYSLLLHCPILLAYNNPSNWVLIYK